MSTEELFKYERCPRCGRTIDNECDELAIQYGGECTACDHIRGDALDAELSLMNEYDYMMIEIEQS